MSTTESENLPLLRQAWEKAPTMREKEIARVRWYEALDRMIADIYKKIRYNENAIQRAAAGGGGGGIPAVRQGATPICRVDYYTERVRDVPRQLVTWVTWPRGMMTELFPVGHNTVLTGIRGDILCEMHGGDSPERHYIEAPLFSGSPAVDARSWLSFKFGFGRSGGSDHGKMFIDCFEHRKDLTAPDPTVTNESSYVSSRTFKSLDVVLDATHVTAYNTGGAGLRIALNLTVFGL